MNIIQTIKEILQPFKLFSTCDFCSLLIPTGRSLCPKCWDRIAWINLRDYCPYCFCIHSMGPCGIFLGNIAFITSGIPAHITYTYNLSEGLAAAISYLLGAHNLVDKIDRIRLYPYSKCPEFMKWFCITIGKLINKEVSLYEKSLCINLHDTIREMVVTYSSMDKGFVNVNTPKISIVI